MLTTMQDAPTLIREAREQAGLSLRALADRADVSYTTICRIEHGQIDPTVGTLRKLLGAVGEELEFGRRAAAAHPQLADLADAWSTDRAGQEQPDWTRLRAFVDYLTRNPAFAAVATRAKPPASGSAFLDNLLAGVADKVADDASIPRPAWTKRIPPLRETWESIGTPRMRAAAAEKAPRQLAARRILIPATTLWRNAAR
jgi:transcriptional regulator with XRE-family HTH domain